jgi:hypothetical protein
MDRAVDMASAAATTTVDDGSVNRTGLDSGTVLGRFLTVDESKHHVYRRDV